MQVRVNAVVEYLMTNTDLLCEFLTNPFGVEQKARDLLSEIDDRPPSEAELERGLFCFQIAFHFLACLTIAARVGDSSLQKESIDRLHDRARAFYARKESQVALFELVVSPAERDRFNAGLPEQPDQPGGARVDAAAPATTMLALFDSVVPHRLREYVDAIGQPSHPHRLYPVAERVLFHYGARQYRPAAVAAVADFLAVNYNTAIVVSGLRAADAPQTEGQDAFMPMPLTPRMPDVTGKRPSKMYSAGTYVLRLVENVGPVGGGNIIRYRYVLALCDKRSGLPICLVTLEDSSSIANVLGVFEQNGSHSNYGTLGSRNLEEFIDQGLVLIRYRFDLGEVEEVALWSQQTRWKFWQNNEAAARTAA
jgi:hypothetical protein